MDTILGVLKFIGIVILVLMVFNVIIIVHEWGHFLAARWRKLHIEKFQIWFGKPIWKKTYNGVQYGLGCIPAGGFVALPQMAPMEAIEGRAEDGKPREQLPPIKPIDKIIVAFAGPLFSFGLAVVFACIVWVVKKPVDEGNKTTTIGYIHAETPAAASDLKIGDKIVTVDGATIDKWHGAVNSLVWGIVSAEGDNIVFGVERDGNVIDVPVKAPRAQIEKDWEERSWIQKIFTRKPMMQVGIGPKSAVMVGEVMENSPAALAGLMKDDVVLKVNGVEPTSPGVVIAAASKGQPLELEVQRGEEVKALSITPRIPDAPEGITETKIGTYFGTPPNVVLKRESPIAQVQHSLTMMWNTLTKVFAPKSKVGAQHLSGPVGIMNLYYQLFQSPDGWRLVLWFSVVLNINLAILNMLPFPVLDGGHITMASLEMLRRKPINTRLLEYVQLACVMLLFGFMIFVTMKDFGQITGIGGDGGGGEIRFDPPKAAN